MSVSPPPASPASPDGSGARVIVTAQMVRFVFRLGSAAVLARLLSPGDYGLNGMAMVIYSLLYMVRDLGVFPAVQQPGLTPQRFNALCRIAFVGGLLLALGCVTLGVPAAWFFDEPRLTLVLAVLALAFVFGGAAVPAYALLYREKRVEAAVTVETVAAVLSSLLAIGAALAGAGVWSLVMMSVLNEFFAAVGAWWQCTGRPGRDTRGAPWRELLGFGAHLTGTSVANYLTRTMDQVIVGRSAGAAELGFYGRGIQATTLPVQLAVAPFSGWAVATLSQRRDRPADFIAHFRRLLKGLLHFSLPPAAVCLVAPAFAVHLLFGEKWLAATEVVRWLGLALLVQPWLYLQGWVLQAQAQARRLTIISVIGLLVLGASCFAVRHQSITHMAAAVAFGTILHSVIAVMLCIGVTPLTRADLFRPALVPLALHCGLALVLLALGFVSGAPWWLPLPVVAGYYAAAWLALPVVRQEVRGHFLFHK